MSYPRRFVATSRPRFGGIASSSSSTPMPSTSIRRVKLTKENELRMEVGPEFSLKLRVLTGTVEIFGTKLCPESWITFRPGMKFAEYFYVPGGDDLAPHSHIAKFSDFYIFRIGTWPPAPRTTIAIGPQAKEDSTRLIAESLSNNLLFQILAVSLANEPSEILSSNVAGFIYVTDVDLLRRRFTYLAPNEIKIPNKYLIAGGVTWVDL